MKKIFDMMIIDFHDRVYTVAIYYNIIVFLIYTLI